ncbi:MAG: hypothetical protein AAFW46_08595 [Pseudomonadota bacterium]
MHIAKLAAAAALTAAVAGCQTTVVRQETVNRGPNIGESRIVPSRAGDLVVTLRRADRGSRLFVVRRADGRAARGGRGPEQASVDAVRRAFPNGSCARGRAPRIEDANYRSGPGTWAVRLSCR